MTASMSDDRRPVSALGSGLVVDIDRHSTRAILFDTVGGHGRFISSCARRSTVLPPIGDGFAAVRDAIRCLEGQSGFTLLGDDGIECPREGLTGVDFVALTGQPATPVRLVFIPIGTSPLLPVLLASARRTSSVVDVLEDNVRTEDGVLSGTMMEARIRSFEPDAVVILDGENTHSEWATAVGTLSSLSAEGAVTQIIIVARDQFQQQAAQTMGEDADLRGIDPAEFEAHDIAAAIELELNSLNESRFETSSFMPATRRVPFTSRVRAGDLVASFLARRREQTVTIATIGDGTAIHSATPDSVITSVRPDIDAHANVRSILATDARYITGMLPFRISDEALSHWILNRSIRPGSVSHTTQDIAIEAAVTSAALRHTWREAGAPASYSQDVVVGGAGLAEWGSPALALLCLLNAIQPVSSTGVVEVYLDRDGMLYAAGAVGELSPALAADVVERDLLCPLASVVVVHSEGAEGDLTVRGEIKYESGRVHQFSVPAGSVHRLGLDGSESAVLTLNCEPNTTIGSSGQGETVVLGDHVRLRGGELGVVIDARGRLVQPGPDSQNHATRVAGWLSDLGEKELSL